MGSKSWNSTSTSYTTNYDYTVGNVGLTGADAVNYAATLGNTLVTLEQGANMTAADALAAGSTVPGTTTGSVVPASAGTGSAPASGTNWTVVIIVAAIGLVVVGGVILFLGRDKK